jgi:hypothetical protein
MSEEKPRNILVSSEEVECNMTIRVPGETITMLARQFWRQGSYLRAIQFLMEGVKNIPWHITIGVLEGRLKFTGDPKITVEVDNEHLKNDLVPYDVAIKRSEKRDDENVMQQSFMLKEHYEEMRLQEEKARMAAIREEIAHNQAMNAKPPMMKEEDIDHAKKLFKPDSFKKMKKESGYDEDDAQKFDIPF